MNNSKFLKAMGVAPDGSEQPVEESKVIDPPTESQTSLPNNPPMIVGEIPSVSGAASGLMSAKRLIPPPRSLSPSIDRLPPHAIEAEQATLGSVLSTLLGATDGDAWPRIDFLITRFGAAGKDAYYELRHQMIFSSMVEMRNQNKKVDVITLQQWLKDKNQLDQIGGIFYLSSLPDIGIPSMMEYYAEIVFEKYTLRTMVHMCVNTVARVYDHEGDVDGLMDEVERDLMNVCRIRTTNQKKTMRDSVHEAISTIEQYSQSQGAPLGISTGFLDWDKMTSGLHPGEMIVIAARPSIGKTSLAMNVVEHVALGQNLPVGVFSLEMKMSALVLRMVCSMSKINIHSVRDGFFNERDMERMNNASAELLKAPIHIEDTPGISVMQLRSKARQMVQEFGCKLFVVDYMSLLTANIGKSRIFNKRDEVGEISHSIKNLANELNVPIIVLSQLNRDLEKYGKKGASRKPKISDLRESGEIEQDADTIGLLSKKEPKEDAVEDPNAVLATLDIAKQRNGPTGEIDLVFLKSFTRFEAAACVGDEDVAGTTTLF